MADMQPAAETAFAYRDPEPFVCEAQGQKLHIFPAGKDRREALMDLVRSAKTCLKVVFYIYAEDSIGEELRDALADAAARGIDVDLVVDGFGASASEQFFERLVAAGGEVCRFSPHRTQRYLIRNHQKMVIVDDKVAMFGGFNIEDDYFAPPQDNGWNDIGIRIEGSAVEGLVDWFARLKDWTDDASAHFRAIRRTVREWDWGSDDLRWLVGGPTRGLSTWARCVSQDLMQAKRLDMFMAYFSPPRRLLKRIGNIAQRGEARLLMAGKSDNGATLGATRALYSYLLKRGTKIWEFRPCKLHTKMVVVDDTVYLGSANFDMRSLYLNLEIMLRIEDAALAARMREFLDHQVAASEAITPELHKSRATLWNRIRWNAGWLLVSVLDYTVSRRLNLGL